MVESLNALKPYVFTYGGAQLFMGFATFTVLPLLYFKLIRKWITSGIGRFVGLLATWVSLLALIYGDVLVIAGQAKALCQADAGLHVYRTAESEGLFGTTSVAYWAVYGFTYVEYQSVGYTRVTMKNGKEILTKIDKPTSRYEYAIENKIIGRGIKEGRALIRDRTTGEILGEHTYFYIYPGWADTKFLGFTGLTFIPPICNAPNAKPLPGAGPDSQAFIKAILKPKNSNSGTPE